MRERKLVQDVLYGRFRDRVAEIGAAGDWPAYKEAMAEEAAKTAEAAAKAKAPPKKGASK